MTVVFDIDGTLSLVGDRVKCLEQNPPDWDQFYERCGEDQPNLPVIETYLSLENQGHTMVLLTGRRESTEKTTITWLWANGVSNYSHLLMRPDGDTRHDTIVKPEQLKLHNIKPDLVFEDRNSMVDHWRSKGIPCFQVAPGDF